MFKEVKESLAKGENIYIRGFGSFITKKRAAKIGRNIKKNTAVQIPAHFIPAFKPAKEFMHEVKKLQLDTPINEDGAEEMADVR
jgi:DNA-binding protein HU-beta